MHRCAVYANVSAVFCLLPDWLLKGEVQKLVVVVTGVETQEVLERWAFEVHTDQKSAAPYVCL